MALDRLLGQEFSRRAFPGGGYSANPGGQFRVDATAWGIIASEAAGLGREILELHRSRLIREQEPDGRVCLSPGRHESYWPTALAVLAWRDSPANHGALELAARFLLGTTGIHFSKQSNSPAAHDPGLRGWPWIENTHSWIEPTAMCVLALRMTGHGHHDRVKEAVHMVLDRQLPNGGWNYGNVLVFGQELRPMPESTGVALTALREVVDGSLVAKSLDYLQGEVHRARTPISLGWSLLGLAAWGRHPSNAEALVERCLVSQTRYGAYDTSALSILVLGALAGAPNVPTPLFQRVNRSHPSTPAA